MTTTNTSKETFTYIVQTRSGNLPSNNRDRGNLLPIFFVLVLALLPVVRLSTNNCSNSNTRQKKEPKWKGSSTLFSCFRINWGSCYFRSVNPLPRTFDLILLWWDTVNHYCLAITFIHIAIITNSVKKKNKKKLKKSA